MLLTVTDVGETLQVVGLLAPVGEVLTVQARLTVPLKEFADVTVMVEVPLEPGLTEMLPPLESVKLVLEFVGETQKPAQPAINGIAAHSRRAQL